MASWDTRLESRPANSSAWALWDAQQVRSLQLGLAAALSRCFELPAGDIQVVTAIVDSGHAVEAGEVQEW